MRKWTKKFFKLFVNQCLINQVEHKSISRYLRGVINIWQVNITILNAYTQIWSNSIIACVRLQIFERLLFLFFFYLFSTGSTFKNITLSKSFLCKAAREILKPIYLGLFMSICMFLTHISNSCGQGFVRDQQCFGPDYRGSVSI